MKIIYIVGSGHCGSTLLDLMLGSNSNIVGVGEIHTLNKQTDTVCTCGAMLKECSFWNSVVTDINDSDMQVHRGKLSLIVGGEKYYDSENHAISSIDYISYNEKLYKKIIDKSGKNIVVDSSKDIDRALLLSNSKQIEPIIVHLVRDAYANTWSYVKKYKRSWPFLLKWILSNIKIEIIKRRFNDARVIRIRYEDLIDNPKKELSKITDSVGVDFENEMIDFRKNLQHQIEGNRMRFEKKGIMPKDISWKYHLRNWQKVFIFFTSEWLNRFYKIRNAK